MAYHGKLGLSWRADVQWVVGLVRLREYAILYAWCLGVRVRRLRPSHASVHRGAWPTEQCWVIGPDHIEQFRISRSTFWVASLKMLQSDPTLLLSDAAPVDAWRVVVHDKMQ